MGDVRRAGPLVWRKKVGEDTKTIPGGAVLTSRYPGSVSLILEMPTGKKNDKGYDEMTRVVKLVDETGKEWDIQGAFLNAHVYHDIGVRETRKKAATGDEIPF